MEFQTLRQGDFGEQVKNMQQMLKSMGYGIPAVNGEFDRMTKNSVRAFQNDKGIDVTGVADRDTYALMEKYSMAGKQEAVSGFARGIQKAEPELRSMPENDVNEWRPWTGQEMAPTSAPVQYTPWEAEKTEAKPYIPYKKKSQHLTRRRIGFL